MNYSDYVAAMPKLVTGDDHLNNIYLDSQNRIAYSKPHTRLRLSSDAQRFIYSKFLETDDAREVLKLFKAFLKPKSCPWSSRTLRAAFTFMKSRIENLEPLPSAERDHWVYVNIPWVHTAGDNAQAETVQPNRLSVTYDQNKGFIVGYILAFAGFRGCKATRDVVLHLGIAEQAFLFTAIELEFLKPDDVALAFNQWTSWSGKSTLTGPAVSEIVKFMGDRWLKAFEISELEHWNCVTQGGYYMRALVQRFTSGNGRRTTDTTVPSSNIPVKSPSSFASAPTIQGTSIAQSEASPWQPPWQTSQPDSEPEYPDELDPLIAPRQQPYPPQVDLLDDLYDSSLLVTRPPQCEASDTPESGQSDSRAQELSPASQEKSYCLRDSPPVARSRTSAGDSLDRLYKEEEARLYAVEGEKATVWLEALEKWGNFDEEHWRGLLDQGNEFNDRHLIEAGEKFAQIQAKDIQDRMKFKKREREYKNFRAKRVIDEVLHLRSSIRKASSMSCC